MQPEHVALHVNEDLRGRTGEPECLPAWNRLRADVARRIAVARAAEPGAIVGEVPHASARQSLADAGAHIGAGQHGGAQRILGYIPLPAEVASLSLAALDRIN